MIEHLRRNWDRVLGWGIIATGGVLLIVGWVGMSGTPYPADQLPYMMSGGIGGVFLLGLGATLLLSADLRDEWHKLDRIEGELTADPDAATENNVVLASVQDDAA